MTEEINKVSWNIAASQAQYVFELIKKSMNYYLVGNLSQWYWSLTALRGMINHSLKETEQEELDSLEKEVQSSLKYWSLYRQVVEGHTERKLSKEELLKKNQFSTYVQKYQRRLMDFLNQLGYFPSKEDRTKINF